MSARSTDRTELSTAPARRFDSFSEGASSVADPAASARPKPTAPRLPRKPLHGVLLLDKPIGWSSNDALQKVKGILRAEKGGHTGTLDPLATGLLPLCFGAATKFSQASLDADKTYRATLKLGVTRVGGDLEGEVIETRPVDFDEALLHAACAGLTGVIDQLPPMHSALKHDGKALYEYARDGVDIDRAPRRVTVHRLDILRWQGDELDIEVCVSKGTYIRTLAEDLGRALGCGAHLTALRRTAGGPVRIEDAITIEALNALEPAEREARLLPPDVLLAGWPAVSLDPGEAGRFLTGLRRRVTAADSPAVRVYGRQPSAFLGTAHIHAGELIATRLLSPLEVQALMHCMPPAGLRPEQPPDARPPDPSVKEPSVTEPSPAARPAAASTEPLSSITP